MLSIAKVNKKRKKKTPRERVHPSGRIQPQTLLLIQAWKNQSPPPLWKKPHPSLTEIIQMVEQSKGYIQSGPPPRSQSWPRAWRAAPCVVRRTAPSGATSSAAPAARRPSCASSSAASGSCAAGVRPLWGDGWPFLQRILVVVFNYRASEKAIAA